MANHLGLPSCKRNYGIIQSIMVIFYFHPESFLKWEWENFILVFEQKCIFFGFCSIKSKICHEINVVSVAENTCEISMYPN